MKTIEWIDAKVNKPEKLTAILSNYCACKCVTNGIRSSIINYYLCVYNFVDNEWLSVETAKRYHVTHFIQIEI